MNKIFGIGLLLMLCACLWLRGSIATVKAERDAARRNEALLMDANAEAETVIENMREAMARDAALVIENLDRQDELSTKMATLERRLREALRHDSTLTLDSVLPAAAADALCLQWREASGRVSSDGQGEAADGADTRAAHTTAAGSGDGIGPQEAGLPRSGAGVFSGEPGFTPGAAQPAIASAAQDVRPSVICANWRKMTVRDAVEWNGLLLRHAGLEREDKAALRQWAAQREGL